MLGCMPNLAALHPVVLTCINGIKWDKNIDFVLYTAVAKWHYTPNIGSTFHDLLRTKDVFHCSNMLQLVVSLADLRKTLPIFYTSIMRSV